jgi:hypothetical protein
MLLAAATALTLATVGFIQQAQPAPRNPSTTATAMRTATAPQIDGVQNDAVWAIAPKTSEFLARTLRSDQDHHRFLQRQSHRLRVRGQSGWREARFRRLR